MAGRTRCHQGFKALYSEGCAQRPAQMIYADTSFFVSLRVPDENSEAAYNFANELSDGDIVWSPLNRVEVFNAIRQLAYQKFISAADARAAIHSCERDVKAGLFRHRETD